MGFCEFQAVKFSQSREIHRCTRKRQGCTRNRHTSGRGSPPDRSIRLCACGTLRTADWYNKLLNDSWTSAEERDTRLWHCSNGVFSLRGLQLRQVSGYGLLWFTCKTMWARSCLAFTTLAVVVNAEFASLEIWTINCDVLISKCFSHDHHRCVVIHVCIYLSILFSCRQVGNLNLLLFGARWV